MIQKGGNNFDYDQFDKAMEHNRTDQINIQLHNLTEDNKKSILTYLWNAMSNEQITDDTIFHVIQIFKDNYDTCNDIFTEAINHNRYALAKQMADLNIIKFDDLFISSYTEKTQKQRNIIDDILFEIIKKDLTSMDEAQIENIIISLIVDKKYNLITKIIDFDEKAKVIISKNIIFKLELSKDNLNKTFSTEPLIHEYISDDKIINDPINKQIFETFILNNLDKINLFLLDSCGRTVIHQLINHHFDTIINNEQFKNHAKYSEARLIKFNTLCKNNSKEYIINGHGGSGQIIINQELQHAIPESFTIVPQNCCFVFLTPSSYFYCINPNFYSDNMSTYIQNLIGFRHCRIYTENTLIPNIKINLNLTMNGKCMSSGIIPIEQFIESMQKTYDAKSHSKCSNASFEYHDNDTFGRQIDCEKVFPFLQSELEKKYPPPIEQSQYPEYSNMLNEKMGIVRKNLLKDNICDETHISTLFDIITRKKINNTQKYVFYSLNCRHYNHNYIEIKNDLCKYNIPEFNVICNKLKSYTFNTEQDLERQYTLSEFDADANYNVNEQDNEQKDNLNLGTKIIQILQYIKDNLIDSLHPIYKKILFEQYYHIDINMIKILISMYVAHKYPQYHSAE
jgi:hypothetical protein